MSPREDEHPLSIAAIFRQAVEESPFGVLLLDSRFRVRSASLGARQTLSTVDALVGRDFRDVLRMVWPEPFASEAIAQFHATLATGTPFRSRATIEVRKDRSLIESYDWSVQRLDAPDGNHELVCHFYDLSERHDRESDLRAAGRRKDQWVATFAHELRSPLAPIRAAAAMLRLASPGTADIRQFATVIDRQAAQMAKLLDDLLDVTRLSRDGFILETQIVSLGMVMEAAIETTQPLIDGNGQTLHVDVDGRCRVKADVARLTQVFVNLLNNAAKYGGPGGQITVTGARERDEVVVRVRDSGIGIRRDMLERIFQLFERGDNARVQSAGGLGIGLALARLIVEAHGGALVAASDGPDCGSEFIVRLLADDETLVRE
jgi:signal transduction histidine kinase